MFTLAGDETALDEDLFGGRGSFRRTSQGCLRAIAGVILTCGSHSRQRRTKSIKLISSQPPRAVVHDLDPGGPRTLPRPDLPGKMMILPFGNNSVGQ